VRARIYSFSAFIGQGREGQRRLCGIFSAGRMLLQPTLNDLIGKSLPRTPLPPELGKSVSNLWAQPLDGSAPCPLTNFSSGQIYNYAFARDGQRLFLARGYPIRDALLIRNFR
jgi:hypothetical protein